MAAITLTVGVITSMLFVIVSSSSDQCNNTLVDKATLSSNSILAWTYNASRGRMSTPSDKSWCSAATYKNLEGYNAPSNPYLQVDLHSTHVVTGVSIKGTTLGEDFYYVKSYVIEYQESVSGSWKKVIDPATSQPKIFTGNSEGNPVTPVYQQFPHPIRVTALRFTNLTPNGPSYNARCMRVEVFGCVLSSSAANCFGYAVATNKGKSPVDACEGLCEKQYGMNYQLAGISNPQEAACIYEVSQQGKQPVWTSLQLRGQQASAKLFDFKTDKEVSFFGGILAKADQKELNYYRQSMLNGGVTVLAKTPIDSSKTVSMPVYVQYAYYFATPDSAPAWNFDEPINCACRQNLA